MSALDYNACQFLAISSLILKWVDNFPIIASFLLVVYQKQTSYVLTLPGKLVFRSIF
jgi:hypothetical protein